MHGRTYCCRLMLYRSVNNFRNLSSIELLSNSAYCRYQSVSDSAGGTTREMYSSYALQINLFSVIRRFHEGRPKVLHEDAELENNGVASH